MRFLLTFRLYEAILFICHIFFATPMVAVFEPQKRNQIKSNFITTILIQNKVAAIIMLLLRLGNFCQNTSHLALPLHIFILSTTLTDFSNTRHWKPAALSYASFQHLRVLSNKIVLYISLVNTSIYPATVDVVKFTALLCTNLYLVLILFFYIVITRLIQHKVHST